DMHPIGVEEAAASEPCRVDERDGVEHERVAVPASHSIAQICDVELRVFSMRAAVGGDDAVLAVSATRIASRIDEGHVFICLVDTSRCSLAWHSQRLAGHDRVVLVRPHVELLHLVPVLRLVYRPTEVAEP